MVMKKEKKSIEEIDKNFMQPRIMMADKDTIKIKNLELYNKVKNLKPGQIINFAFLPTIIIQKNKQEIQLIPPLLYKEEKYFTSEENQIQEKFFLYFIDFFKKEILSKETVFSNLNNDEIRIIMNDHIKKEVKKTTKEIVRKKEKEKNDK